MTLKERLYNYCNADLEQQCNARLDGAKKLVEILPLCHTTSDERLESILTNKNIQPNTPKNNVVAENLGKQVYLFRGIGRFPGVVGLLFNNNKVDVNHKIQQAPFDTGATDKKWMQNTSDKEKIDFVKSNSIDFPNNELFAKYIALLFNEVKNYYDPDKLPKNTNHGLFSNYPNIQQDPTNDPIRADKEPSHDARGVAWEVRCSEPIPTNNIEICFLPRSIADGYKALLEELMQQGRTIIVVTDDKERPSDDLLTFTKIYIEKCTNNPAMQPFDIVDLITDEYVKWHILISRF